jgi:hypothetical protein
MSIDLSLAKLTDPAIFYSLELCGAGMSFLTIERRSLTGMVLDLLLHDDFPGGGLADLAAEANVGEDSLPHDTICRDWVDDCDATE